MKTTLFTTLTKVTDLVLGDEVHVYNYNTVYRKGSYEEQILMYLLSIF